ncbi:MAG: GNAT family N-acetyltransferase [Actinobacteria bacterium]|nr:GNAT family N-acetyltransferase [Actinomycetota bacterium]
MSTETWWLDETPIEHFLVDEYDIRAYVPSDVEMIVSAVTESIEHLRPWMPWVAFEPQSIEQRSVLVREWQSDWSNKKDFNFGIFAGDNHVGSTGLHPRSDRGCLEIGYWVHAKHLNRGIATLAAQTMLEAAFGMKPVLAVELVHDSKNVPSRRIAEKIGFVLHEEFLKVDDSYYSHVASAPAESGVMCRWRMSRDRWSTLWGENH